MGMGTIRRRPSGVHRAWWLRPGGPKTGFVIGTFVKRSATEFAAALLAFVVAAIPQAIGQLDSVNLVPLARAPVLQWLNASVKDVLARLALPLVPTVLMVGVVVGLVIGRPVGGRAEWVRSRLATPATSALLGSIAAFVMLVYLVRGGSELLTGNIQIHPAIRRPSHTRGRELVHGAKRWVEESNQDGAYQIGNRGCGDPGCCGATIRLEPVDSKRELLGNPKSRNRCGADLPRRQRCCPRASRSDSGWVGLYAFGHHDHCLG